MKIPTFYGAVAIGIILLLTSSSTESAVRMQLKLSSPQPTVPIEGTLKIKFTFTNDGNQPLLFYPELDWAYNGTVDYVVVRPSGEEMPKLLVVEEYLQEKRKIELEKLVRIDPQQSHVLEDEFDVSTLVQEPGQYELRVMYLSPVTLQKQDGVYIWTESRGPIFGTMQFRAE